MNTPPPPSIPPRQLDECIKAMQILRDELLMVSFLLRDHLFEADHAGREQARQAAEQLILRARNE